MENIKHFKVEGWYLDTFPEAMAYVVKSKKKGAYKGRKDVFVLTELQDGAWSNYMDYLRAESKQNYALTILHMCYLSMRDDVIAHGDIDDFIDFQDEVRRTVRDYNIPMRYVRQYTKLKFDELRNPQTKRVEMRLLPVEP